MFTYGRCFEREREREIEQYMYIIFLKVVPLCSWSLKFNSICSFSCRKNKCLINLDCCDFIRCICSNSLKYNCVIICLVYLVLVVQALNFDDTNLILFIAFLNVTMNARAINMHILFFLINKPRIWTFLFYSPNRTPPDTANGYI